VSMKKEAPLATDPVARVEGISFAYDSEPILNEVSLEIRPGEFVALVGPNGSGKSTLLKVMLGLLEPLAGRATLFGVVPGRFRDRGRLGYVPQRPALGHDLPATVDEVVSMGRLSARSWHTRLSPADRDEVEHALETVGLAHLRQSRVRELSAGQQQRVFIARALTSRPSLLVLDEPIAGVDGESQRRFRDSLTHLVEEHEAAILLVSHELGVVAEEIDRIVVLRRQVLFDGPPDELVRTGVSLGIHQEDLPLWLEGLR
jgi:zinc transport system ATP-binding protein